MDGDYLRQQREQDEMGVTAATPMPMMPSESQMLSDSSHIKGSSMKVSFFICLVF